MKYSINDLAYGGKYHDQCWNPQFNKEATIPNALANCTAAVIAFCLIEKNPLPVSVISDASGWHNFLTNGWRCIDFDVNKVKVGDIIQWVDKCHVCQVADIVDGTIYVNGSFYTGEHGVAYYNGKYDTRNRFKSLQELSDFMLENYPTRFYHHWTLEKEAQMTGGKPEHILVCPVTVSPVERNTNVNQIQTMNEGLRIRTAPSLSSEIVGHVQLGYYNVLSRKDATVEDKDEVSGLTCWYKLAENRWCGNVTTNYLPATDDSDIIRQIEEAFSTLRSKITDLSDTNKKLKEGVEEIVEIGKKLIS
jgi:hypothetical protein